MFYVTKRRNRASSNASSKEAQSETALARNQFSPLRFFLFVAASVFVAEILVWSLPTLLSPTATLQSAIFGRLLLTALVFSALYLFWFQRLVAPPAPPEPVPDSCTPDLNATDEKIFGSLVVNGDDTVPATVSEPIDEQDLLAVDMNEALLAPVTQWDRDVGWRLPDEWIRLKSPPAKRIEWLVKAYYGWYPSTARHELARALLPFLAPLVGSGVEVSDRHREACEHVVVDWASKQSGHPIGPFPDPR